MKPMQRLTNYLNNTKDNEFTPCTRQDLDVIIAMQDPSYIARHAAAVLNYNK